MAEAICVFCSSSNAIDPRYLDLASQVGTAIGRRGWNLISGGGSVSMMGAVATSAREAGAHTTGVIPDALRAMEVADHGADELVVTTDMRQRKGLMDERSDAFLALPGGIGTLEELIEVWTSRSLNMHDKPVVVLDPWGDYFHLHALLDHWVDVGFIQPMAVARAHWASSVDEAMDAISEQLGL